MNSQGLPSPDAIELERTGSNTRIIEIIFGLFGGFGLGWLYAGNIAVAIILLLFSLFYSIIVWSMVTASFGICSCFTLPMSIAIAFISGNNARAWAMKTRAQGSILRMILGLAVIVIGVIIGVTILGGAIALAASQYNPIQ